MADIVPKLNLNRTPNIVENNSLIFAKNIRLDVDKTIHKDYGISSIITKSDILHRILDDINSMYNGTDEYLDYFNNLVTKLTDAVDYNNEPAEYTICGVITNSNMFYIFIAGHIVHVNDYNSPEETISFIVSYNEEIKKFAPCNCNWKWSGGNVEGCVITNLKGDTILNIGEYGTTKLVPFKSINLNKSKYSDDESIYTQSPKIPYININCYDTFRYIIPNGIYQFYVRYKIRDNFYTDWFLASRELYAGNSFSTNTHFGKVKYVNTHTDSDKSFILSIDKALPNNIDTYESFQIGFILSHDDAIYARAWKHFPIGVETINFDYRGEDAVEIEVIDLLKSTYQLYNVGNITSFKNKLYISNYTESNFNENLNKYAKNIDIELNFEKSKPGYGNYIIITENIGNTNYISGLTIDGQDKLIKGESGIINEIFNEGVKDKIDINCTIAVEGTIRNNYSKYDFTCNLYAESLNFSKSIINIKDPKRNSSANLYIDKIKSYEENIIKSIKVYKEKKPTSIGNFNTDPILTIKNIKIVNDGIKAALKAIYDNIYVMDYKGNLYSTTMDKIKDYTIVIERSIICDVIYPSNKNNAKPITGNIIDTINPISPDDNIVINPDNPIIGGGSTTETNVERSYNQFFELNFSTNKNIINSNIVDNIKQYNTLIPYQTYKFYVHYCKNNGEITNGFEIKELTVPYSEYSNKIIYPIFHNIEIPKELGYEACFISILHTKNKVSTIFDLTNAKSYYGNNTLYFEGRCIDLDIGLINGIDDIPIWQQVKKSDIGDSKPPIIDIDGNFEIIDKPSIPLSDNADELINIELRGDYYHSSNSAIVRYFGACGIIQINQDTNLNENKNAYIVQDYSISENDVITLTKCTPYISENGTYDNYKTLNTLGFICDVYPIDKKFSINNYSDGSSLYGRKNKDSYDGNEDNTPILKEYGQYIDSTPSLDSLEIPNTNKVTIYSNYNLNYLTLTEEPNKVIKSLYPYKEGETVDTKTITFTSKMLFLFNSLILNSVYSLPSMYRNFTRKYFYTYRNNSITTFNNTIRSSVLSGDESELDIIKFDAEDYYNVPTNRGIIVNLKAIGDAILVHTKDSMFKFSGSNTIQSSQGEIITNESQPFDTGISEMFGSEKGFAGLKYKKDHIITETGYIFYDRDSRIIYMYSGQGQLKKISSNIEKLFNHENITDITFANDYYNNRFFVCIEFNNENKNYKYYVNLSFNFNEDVTDFVSLHDFYFKNSFNTKTKCYFLDPKLYVNKSISEMNIYSIDKSNNDYYPTCMVEYDRWLYPSVIGINERINSIFYNKFSSIIDIIVNSNYETVKILNSISWISNYIEKEFPEGSDIIEIGNTTAIKVIDLNFKLSEDKFILKPFDKFVIYTDSCSTKVIDYNNMSNNVSPIYDERATPKFNSNSYKYPRYNQGKWTLNYFRNIENTEDVFGYLNNLPNGKPKYDDGRRTSKERADYISDNNSLIEGKYFVVRFFFDKEFKLETLSLYYDNKL